MSCSSGVHTEYWIFHRRQNRMQKRAWSPIQYYNMSLSATHGLCDCYYTLSLLFTRFFILFLFVSRFLLTHISFCFSFLTITEWRWRMRKTFRFSMYKLYCCAWFRLGFFILIRWPSKSWLTWTVLSRQNCRSSQILYPWHADNFVANVYSWFFSDIHIQFDPARSIRSETMNKSWISS